MAGRQKAAVAEWRVALRIVEQRRIRNPHAAGNLADEAMLDALPGERAAAGDTLRICGQLSRQPAGRASGFSWTIYAALGRKTEVADFFADQLKGKPTVFPRYNAALVSVHPSLDRFRTQPRLQALNAEAERLTRSAAP